MPQLSEQERDEFLAVLRQGILSMVRQDGSPISVPVWFEWNGEIVSLFAYAESPKIKRLRANPRASLLVTSNLDEVEMWVV